MSVERIEAPGLAATVAAVGCWSSVLVNVGCGTADAARALLQSVRGDRFSALWTVLLTTGLRRGEGLGLKWGDVDLDAGRLAGRRALVATEYQVRYSETKRSAYRRVVSLDPGTAGSADGPAGVRTQQHG